ncbi:MAG: hypothetical protein M3R62_05200 [Acidobacteriota bacterium]|nr:hypothetical protein [Acidobacteriota bacterium]
MPRSALVTRRWALAAVFLGAAACMRDSPTGPHTSGRVASGPWGGDRIQLTVTDSGGTLQQLCARGTIDRPLVLDSGGRFDATGSYIRQRGGPIRLDDIHPARFTGSTDGTTLTLTVTDSGGTLQHLCAQGKIDQPLVLDSGGRFDATGTYTRQRGGPIRLEDIHPARFTGSTDGTTLTLTVTQTDDGQVFGPFSMRFGSVIDVGACPLV